jgi:hypothetical protein
MLLLVAALLAGCNGGTVDHHALKNDGKTLDSIACEGALVADGIASDRMWVYYAREQAEELNIQSSNLADALSKRPTVPGIEQAVRAEARRAASLAALLHQMQVHPNDDARAASLERALKQAGKCK